jgi:hypothetical protein
MIQRIQSLFLAVVIVISLFLFNGSYLVFSENSGSVIKVAFSGIERNNAEEGSQLLQIVYPYSALVILIPLLSLITLVVYKKRRIQLWLVLTLIVIVFLLIGMSVYYYRFVSTTYSSRFDPGFMLVIPLLLLLFSFLAYRGIKKDDQLVKSYDRLR